MNKQQITVDDLPGTTAVYQPTEEHMPDDLLSSDVYLSLPNGKQQYPHIPADGWLTLELVDIEDPNVLDEHVLAARLLATVRLQRATGIGNTFKEVGEETIDVTRDVLALDVEKIRQLVNDFDDLKLPYIEMLPGTQAQELARRHAGPTEVHLSVADFFDAMGLLPDGAKGAEWISEEMLAQARKLMGVQFRRITAHFQPQAWQNDYTIDIDGAREVDVTAAVLKHELCRIHAFVDYKESVECLVDPVALGHDGPFSVRVTGSICDYFGVDRLDEIVEEMLGEAREEQAIVEALTPALPREIRVDAFEIVIALHPTGATITSCAHAANEPEAMKHAVDAVLSLVKSHAQNGIDVTDLRYAQGVKHALENVWAQFASQETPPSTSH
ncbi:hypothetical protein [Paraburkholderia youngii]|uniref:hypothetical protein n=1 Tax=Paraburkholderia youngii TaxID=2782701 RepID=UPI003D21258A